MKCHNKLKALVDEYAKRGNFDTTMSSLNTRHAVRSRTKPTSRRSSSGPAA